MAPAMAASESEAVHRIAGWPRNLGVHMGLDDLDATITVIRAAGDTVILLSSTRRCERWPVCIGLGQNPLGISFQ
jgi:hypothetical protein